MNTLRTLGLLTLLSGLLSACGGGSSSTSPAPADDLSIATVSDVSMLAPAAGFDTLPVTLHVSSAIKSSGTLTVTAPNAPSGVSIDTASVGGFSGEGAISFKIHAQAGTKPLAGLTLHVQVGSSSADYIFPLLVGRAYTLKDPSPAYAGAPFLPQTLAIGADNSLWFTANNNPYYRFIPATQTTQSYPGSAHLNFTTTGLTPDPDGSVWLLTDHNEVEHAHPDTGISEAISVPPDVGYKQVILTSDHRSWYQTYPGPDLSELLPATLNTQTQALTSGSPLTALVPDGQGHLWGTDTQDANLLRYTTATGSVSTMSFAASDSSLLYSPTVLPDQTLYLFGLTPGSHTSALIHYDPASGQSTRYHLSGFYLSNPLAAPDSSLWSLAAASDGSQGVLSYIDIANKQVIPIPTLPGEPGQYAGYVADLKEGTAGFDHAGNLWYLGSGSLLAEVPLSEMGISKLGLRAQSSPAQSLRALNLPHHALR